MVQGLNIGKNALIVNQAALTVVGNNIANMNTVGYSKQRVNLAALNCATGSKTPMQEAYSGYGVEIESITRYRDAFLDSYYRDSVGAKSYYETLSTNGLMLEGIANEFTGSGLSNYINDFFEAANSLSLHPTDVTMKTNFVQKAVNLADEFRNISGQLTAARTNLVGDPSNIASYETCEAKATTDEINQLLNDICKVNETIIYQHNSKLGSAAGLLDQRDGLLDKLSEFIPVTVENNPNGSVNIYLDNIQLVGGSIQKGSFKLNQGNANNPARISFESDEGKVYSKDVKNLLGQSGKLSAILTLGGDSTTSVTIKSMLDDLNKLASNFAATINDIQIRDTVGPPTMSAAYYDSNDKQLHLSSTIIFTSDSSRSTYGLTAANIRVNDAILKNNQLVATAYVPATYHTDPDDPYHNWFTIDDPLEVGNNKTALAFVNAREQSIAGLKGLTFEDFNTSMVSNFGSRLANANTNYETQQKVLESANSKRESTIGVNVEEELMDLVKYQRAYEASARVFSTSDEVLQTLVNLAR